MWTHLFYKNYYKYRESYKYSIISKSFSNDNYDKDQYYNDDN